MLTALQAAMEWVNVQPVGNLDDAETVDDAPPERRRRLPGTGARDVLPPAPSAEGMSPSGREPVVAPGSIEIGEVEVHIHPPPPPHAVPRKAPPQAATGSRLSRGFSTGLGLKQG